MFNSVSRFEFANTQKFAYSCRSVGRDAWTNQHEMLLDYIISTTE